MNNQNKTSAIVFLFSILLAASCFSGSGSESELDTSTSSGTGTGDSSTDGDGDAGMGKSRAELCDPWIDTCTDTDYDYECKISSELIGSDYEYNFTCRIFVDTLGDGLSGSPCSSAIGDQFCKQGFICSEASAMPSESCESERCCAPICASGDICSDGSECNVQYWEPELADYLDVYTGIGFCPSG